MYRLCGRYRYTHGVVSVGVRCILYYSFLKNLLQNWRAAVAMAVSVPPTFPGFVDNVKARGGVQPGIGPRLFDIAFLLGVRSVHVFESLEYAKTGVYSFLWRQQSILHSQKSSRLKKPSSIVPS